MKPLRIDECGFGAEAYYELQATIRKRRCRCEPGYRCGVCDSGWDHFTERQRHDWGEALEFERRASRLFNFWRSGALSDLSWQPLWVESMGGLDLSKRAIQTILRAPERIMVWPPRFTAPVSYLSHSNNRQIGLINFEKGTLWMQLPALPSAKDAEKRERLALRRQLEAELAEAEGLAE